MQHSERLSGTGLCRRSRQAGRRLSRPPVRRLDLPEDHAGARPDRVLRARAAQPAAGRHRRRRRRHLHLHPRARGLRHLAGPDRPRISARPGSTTSSRSARSSGGAATAIRPSIPPGSTSRRASPRRIAARSPPTARPSPSRSARRSSSTAGPWWRRASPQLAAQLAEKAGSVSHDGESVYAAHAVGGDGGRGVRARAISTICSIPACRSFPRDCLIAKLIADIRAWHKQNPDWRDTRQLIEDHYGYDKYPGNCHVVPNHALMVMAVLYAPRRFPARRR